jgi:hypothetical protein
MNRRLTAPLCTAVVAGVLALFLQHNKEIPSPLPKSGSEHGGAPKHKAGGGVSVSNTKTTRGTKDIAPPSSLPSTNESTSKDYELLLKAADSVIGEIRKELELLEKSRTVYSQNVQTPQGTVVKAVVSAPTADEISIARGAAVARLAQLHPNAGRIAHGDAERILADFLDFKTRSRVVLFAAAADVNNKNDIYYYVIPTDSPDQVVINEDGSIAGAPLDFSGMKRWPMDNFSPPPRYGHLFSYEEN